MFGDADEIDLELLLSGCQLLDVMVVLSGSQAVNVLKNDTESVRFFGA